MKRFKLRAGDCVEEMRRIEACSVSAIVTDPPYGLKFMGKEWDDAGEGAQQQEWHRRWLAEAYRVLVPGGMLAAFAGSRTYHHLACAAEDVGFVIVDELMWLYGSGFPKSLDVSKAIDRKGGYPHLAIEIGKALKDSREQRGLSMSECDKRYCGGTTNWSWYEGRPSGQRAPDSKTFQAIVNDWPELTALADIVKEAEREVIRKSAWSNSVNHFVPGAGHKERVNLDITAPATDQAAQWEGWGTALKPAHEPILLAAKPGNRADNKEGREA